jgi:hypothetical protein
VLGRRCAGWYDAGAGLEERVWANSGADGGASCCSRNTTSSERTGRATQRAKIGIKNKCLNAAWNEIYLEKVLFET